MFLLCKPFKKPHEIRTQQIYTSHIYEFYTKSTESKRM